MVKRFRGVYPPSITVFKKDGDIDREGIEQHINFLIENGADGIIPCGSTGEFFNLTLRERKIVLKVFIDHINNRVPALAGTAACSTRTTVELSKYAEDLGYDGLLIVPPYYYKPNDEEIYWHYKTVSRSVDIPIMLYNNPGASKVLVPPDLLVKMAQDDMIQYVKQTHPNLAYVHEIIHFGKGGKPVLFYGMDENAYEAFTVGAVGWVSGASNATIKSQKQLFDTVVEEKNYEKGRELYYRLLPWFLLTERRGRWIAYTKAALELMGYQVGEPRSPIMSLNKREKEEIRSALGLIDPKLLGK